MSSTAKLRKAHVAFLKALEPGTVIRLVSSEKAVDLDFTKTEQQNRFSSENRAFKKSPRPALGLRSK